MTPLPSLACHNCRHRHHSCRRRHCLFVTHHPHHRCHCPCHPHPCPLRCPPASSPSPSPTLLPSPSPSPLSPSIACHPRYHRSCRQSHRSLYCTPPCPKRVGCWETALSAGFSPWGAVVSLLTGTFRLATALASFNMSSEIFFRSSMRTKELICCKYSSGPGPRAVP